MASSNRAARSSQLSPNAEEMVAVVGAVIGGLGDSTNGRAKRKDRARGMNAFVRGTALLGVLLRPEDACKRGASAAGDGSVYSRFDSAARPSPDVSIGGNSGDR